MIGWLKTLQPTSTPMHTQIKGIGVLGDSQSDEYQADDNRGGAYGDTTRNWVELLAKYRSLPFGQWGVWEETRREGYAYNWARSGATTNSLLESGQDIGVAQQVKQEKVNIVVIFIGANDFAPYTTQDGYQAIYDGSMTDAQVTRKVNLLVANIKTALDVIQASGNVKILLVKIPDWSNHIAVQVAFPIPEQRDRVSKAVTFANDQLEDIVKTRNIPTVDPNAFLESVSENKNGVIVKVGDVILQRLLLNNDPHNMFLDDGIHTGTVMNGLFANYIIAAMNTNFGTDIKPLSTIEVLNVAGIY